RARPAAGDAGPAGIARYANQESCPKDRDEEAANRCIETDVRLAHGGKGAGNRGDGACFAKGEARQDRESACTGARRGDSGWAGEDLSEGCVCAESSECVGAAGG